MNANLQVFDGIKTSDIQEILIRSANDLISLEAPNYQFVAARLLLFGLRKQVYNGHPDLRPHIQEHVWDCIERGVYDESILKAYSEEGGTRSNPLSIMTVTICLHMLVCDR